MRSRILSILKILIIREFLRIQKFQLPADLTKRSVNFWSTLLMFTIRSIYTIVELNRYATIWGGDYIVAWFVYLSQLTTMYCAIPLKRSRCRLWWEENGFQRILTTVKNRANFVNFYEFHDRRLYEFPVQWRSVNNEDGSYEFEGFTTQFPLVPLIRGDDVGLVKVRVRLRAAVALHDWLLNHLTWVLRLYRQYRWPRQRRETDPILNVVVELMDSQKKLGIERVQACTR